MSYCDFPYGSFGIEKDRTLWNVLRGKCSWAAWREHRRFLSDPAAQRRAAYLGGCVANIRAETVQVKKWLDAGEDVAKRLKEKGHV